MSDKKHNLIDLLGVTPKNLKVNYPHLYEDLMGISAETSETEPINFRGYNPDYKDFLARAETVEECLSIITYLENQKEISAKLAVNLRKLVHEEGPGVFGYRSNDYYFKAIRKNHT